MKIIVLGTGCAGCKALYDNTRQAVAELKIDASVVKEEDMTRIMSYDVMRLPALVIDDKVVSAGKRLTVSEVEVLLTRLSMK